MALSVRERKELFSATKERLGQVIGASGKSEELVRLTKEIVQAAQKLAQGTNDDMRNKSTSILAEFVIAAKRIAQDTRAVDAASLQKLSSTRKAVEVLVEELDAWHSPQSSSRDETDLGLENILVRTSSQTEKAGGGGSVGVGLKVGNRSSPTGSTSSASNIVVNTEQEKILLIDLRIQQEELVKKKEPQCSPTQHRGKTEDTLKMLVVGLSRSISQLMDLAGQRSLCKETLIDPAITLARMICILLDVVDCLFVSKYPMRMQVHSFTCVLVDQVVMFGNQSKSDDMASLRLITTQCPALMNALKVMFTQCYERSQSIQENQKSHELDLNISGHSPMGSPIGNKRKEPPPTPPTKKTLSPVVQDFEICCMICTSVAVDCNTKFLLNKGTEIMLKALATTTVRDVRKMLVDRTSIPFDDIQLRFRGDDVLTDDTCVTQDNPVPYFVFHLHEPGDEEMTEFRKAQRRKMRIRIDTADWSRVTSPVAVAIYDYEAMADPGEEDNLEFEEGDIIEILEKSADGWWTGRANGGEGVFPASFVEMIQIPKTKDERKRLLKRFQQGKLGEDGSQAAGSEKDPQLPPGRPPDPKTSQQAHHPSSSSSFSSVAHSEPGGSNRKSNRLSNSSDMSDTPRSPSPTKKSSSFGKSDVKMREPHYNQSEKESKQKKRRSLFKRKQHSNSTSSYMALTDDFQRSPILESKHGGRDSAPKVAIPELDEEVRPPTHLTGNKTSAVPGRPLFRPKSSPRLFKASQPSPLQKGMVEEGGVSGSVGSDRSKEGGHRPPPPPPPPYAKRYGKKGMHSLVMRQNSDGELKDDNENVPSQSILSKHGGSLSSYGKEEDEYPVSMTITPASPVVVRQESSPILRRGKREEEEEGEDTPIPPLSGSNSMDDLFKNLEEFDELSSNLSLNNGFVQCQKDYATIPQEELLQAKVHEEEEESGNMLPRCASVPTASFNPPMFDDRPCLTPSPLGVSCDPTTSKQNPSLSHDSSTSSSFSTPVKPPRSKRKKAVEEDSIEPKIDSAASQPPPLPPALQKQSSSSQLQGRPMFHKPKPPPKPHSSSPPDNLSRRETRESKPAPGVGGKGRVRNESPIAPPRRKSRPQLENAGIGKPSLQTKPSKKPIAPVTGMSSPNDVSNPRNLGRLKQESSTYGSEFVDSEVDNCTGVGKEGLLHIQGISTGDEQWKSRYLHLQTKRLAFFDTSTHSDKVDPSEVIPTSIIEEVAFIGEKNRLQCFTIKRQADEPVILGCHSITDMQDWIRSIRKVTRHSRKRDHSSSGSILSLSYNAALMCISHLSSSHLVRENRLISPSSVGNPVLIRKLLAAIDNAENVDLNSLEDATSVMGLLLCLFDGAHLGCLVGHKLAEEMLDSTKSADPISILASKMEVLNPKFRELFKKILRFFGKVLQHTDKNHTEVQDINQVFGHVIFEAIPPSHSEPLLAYLISTCEFVIT